MNELLSAKEARVAGMRQVLRAVAQGRATRVYVAMDAAQRLIYELEEAANAAQIPLERVDTMEELGKACRLQVGTAAAASVRQA